MAHHAVAGGSGEVLVLEGSRGAVRVSASYQTIVFDSRCGRTAADGGLCCEKVVRRGVTSGNSVSTEAIMIAIRSNAKEATSQE